MTTQELTLEPLTAEAFTPFGDLIHSHERDYFLINDGQCRRYHRLAKVETGTDGGAILSLFRPRPISLPHTLVLMERHPLGSQAFVPLAGQPYIVVVAPPGPPPAVADLRAFLITDGTGVNYHAGTWHHPLLALSPGGDFLVVDREGPGHNCEEHLLEGIRLPVAPV